MKGLIGRKVGMTQVFAENGDAVPVTVLELGPCPVVQVKTPEKDGYSAVQIGFEPLEKKDPRKVAKPARGHFAKASVKPHRFLREFRLSEGSATYKPGDTITAQVLEGAHFVSITGVSKGKGFQGVVKRYGFKGQPASRGTHEYFRHVGSVGMREFPGRVTPGKKMPGHMGAERVTTLNMELVRIFPEQNLVLVKGSVPGATGDLVSVAASVRKEKKVHKAAEARFVNPLKASKKKSGK
ncbi:MAG: 50S ribosomal protein L3 [Nitrospinae bacterium]|nr:50S ribosomal protein L3 [Nitrospinota bacterium]